MITLKNKNNITDNSPIALFDSGVGGLTVLSKLKTLMPNEKYVYYGDTQHMPYGEKTKQQLLNYSDSIFKFFEQKGCKAVVMACNTTSSVIYDLVKNDYNFKLYSIVHSVSEVLSKLDIKRLGVFATRATIESGAYQTKISAANPNIKVFGQYCPNWVHFVEENSMNLPENKAQIKSDLVKMMKNDPDKILLGCTHYPFLLDVLSEYVSADIFIDPAQYFAQYIKTDLEQNNLLSTGDNTVCEFYVSSNPKQFTESAKMFCEMQELPQLLTF